MAGVAGAVHHAPLRADVIVAAFTFPAVAAADKVLGLDADPVANFKVFDPGSQRLNHAGKFVTLLPRNVLCGRAVAAVVVQVGAADTGGLDADQDLARSRFWCRPVFDADIFFAVEECGFHRSSYTCGIPFDASTS